MDLETEGWRIREAYNFGMPRPGDATFARSFDQMSLCLAVQVSFLDILVFRVYMCLW